MVIITLLVGILLRIRDIGAEYFFEGELGKEMLYLRQYSLLGRLPITGMTTSHEWLSYGPFYYWIMMPIYSLFKGNPFILFWTALAVASLGMLISYLVVKKIADKKVAIYSTIIQAVSPLLIWQTRNSKLHVFFFLLIPLFMYLLYLIWNGKKRWVIWAGVVFGLMFSFHFSQIPLLGVVILLFWLKKNIYLWTDWLKFAVGAAIPNITLIWQDKNILIWLPYRALNIADKNPSGTIGAFLEYFGRNFFWNKDLWIVGTVIFVMVFAHFCWTERKKFTKDFLTFYLISSIGIMLLANIIHGAFPVHYFLPIFVTAPILFAIYLAKYKYALLVFLIIFFVNLQGYLTFQKPDAYISYSKLNEVANFIVADAKGKPLSIKRVGPYDYFPEEYSQNYKYLVLWKGGNLVDGSNNVYTITESADGTVSVTK